MEHCSFLSWPRGRLSGIPNPLSASTAAHYKNHKQRSCFNSTARATWGPLRDRVYGLCKCAQCGISSVANERVATLYTGSHPAVLQLIKMVIRAGRRFDIQTSICGEIAGDVVYTMLLMGMGLRTLSLVPSQLPNVKRVIRSVDIGMCERLARKVGSFDSERQVLNCLREKVQEVVPGMDGGWTAG